MDDIISAIIGAFKAAGFLLLILVMSPIALAFKRWAPEHPFRIPRLFHFLLLKLMGVRVRVHGAPSSASPVLFVSNHTSYLDVPVLGHILSAGFVAKSEVADWPVFGFMARVQNTVFIERRKTCAADQRTQLQEYLSKKRDLILFPEGTSTDGLEVLPFKSALFSIVDDSTEGQNITVQPVSVTCVELDDFPMLREERAEYAWYGDLSMVPHLWNAFQHKGFLVEVIFHAPFTYADYPNRKDLAVACQDAVTKGVKQSLAHHQSA
ncbi:MAG: lysophospholipid acyltransferase family protein [Bdellovibrionales bacterium]